MALGVRAIARTLKALSPFFSDVSEASNAAVTKSVET